MVFYYETYSLFKIKFLTLQLICLSFLTLQLTLSIEINKFTTLTEAMDETTFHVR